MTTTPATQALLPVTMKPCPFCGFDSQCLTKVTAGAGMFDALQCQNCGATGPYNANYAVPGDGPTRWNTRQAHSLPGDVGIVAEIKAHVDRYTVHDDARRIYSTAQLETAIRLALAALTPSALSGDAGAAGPWLKVGTFDPEPDALYLVQGTLRTSVKRGSEIDSDNVDAALIAPSIAALSGDAGEMRECPNSPSGKHQVDTSMEEGPHHCFHCSVNMRAAHQGAGE